MDRSAFGCACSLLLLLLPGLRPQARAQAGAAQAVASQASETVEVIETTADQSELLVHKHLSFTPRTGATASARTIQIELDPATTYQTIDGFGASLTDSSASLLARMPEAERDAAMHQIFDPAGPLGLTLLRQPLGASDFSAKGDYSYDDPPGNKPDPGLIYFSTKPDEAYLFPLLREAEHLNPQLRVMALPWSAPAWMKTGGSMRAGSLAEADLQVYGAYFARTVEAYALQGIPVWALALQNEPLNENPSYPTQRMLPGQEAKLAAVLEPLLDRAGRAPLVLGYEHNWDRLDYPASLLAASASLSTKPLFAGISFHCYAGNESAQAAFLLAHPGVDLWFTECSATARSAFADTFLWQGRHLLLGAPRNGARSVLLWNILLDPNGDPHNGGCKDCTALLTLEGHGGASKLVPTAGYYLLAQAAPYVHPGAQRIRANVTGSTDLLVTAYHNLDGTFATLVLNAAQTPAQTTVAAGTSSVDYTIPARALVTFTWGVPSPTILEGTWLLACAPALVLRAAQGKPLASATLSSTVTPDELWTVRRLPSGRYEIRNVLTAEALAVDASGHLAALGLRGSQVAALDLYATPQGFCIQPAQHAACTTATSENLPPASTLLRALPMPESFSIDKQ